MTGDLPDDFLRMEGHNADQNAEPAGMGQLSPASSLAAFGGFAQVGGGILTMTIVQVSSLKL